MTGLQMQLLEKFDLTQTVVGSMGDTTCCLDTALRWNRRKFIMSRAGAVFNSGPPNGDTPSDRNAPCRYSDPSQWVSFCSNLVWQGRFSTP